MKVLHIYFFFQKSNYIQLFLNNKTFEITSVKIFHSIVIYVQPTTGIGKVNFDGFCQIASHFLEEDDSDAMEEELREAFRLYDKEGEGIEDQKCNEINYSTLRRCLIGNGYITTATLREILAALDDKLTSEDLDGIISEIDTDGSGTVDFDGELGFFL